MCWQLPCRADDMTQPVFDPSVPPIATSRACQARSATQALTSSLPSILKGIRHDGWEEIGLRTYRIADGRLAIFDAAAQPTETGSSPALELSCPASNSEASILEEFDCLSIAQKVFKRGSRFITVKAFEFEKSDGANAGYDLLRKGSTTVVKRGDGSSEDGDSISFWQDKFLFILTSTSEDDDESKEVITKFAQHLSLITITHAQPPGILTRLPVIDRVKGTEKIVMGPLSASKYFPAPSLDALSMEQARAAAVADYQMFLPARERVKLLYIDYGDPRLAQEAYNSYQSRLQQLHPPHEDWPAEGRVLFRLNKVYLLSQLRQPGRLVIIYGARKAKSPIILARQILDR